VTLYQRDRLTLGQASRLATMDQAQFQLLLASREIPIHYDAADFDADPKTLEDMYRQMAQDEQREADALAWIDGVRGIGQRAICLTFNCS
jgi:hypothetical protein